MARLGRSQLFKALIHSAVTFFAAAQTIAAPVASLSWSVPAPTLVATVTLSADVATATWTVPSATLAPGAVTLAASSAISTWTVPGVTVVAGSITVQADAAVANWIAASATVVPGAVTLTPASIEVPWSVPAPTLVPGAVTLAAEVAVSAWTTPTATVLPGAVTLTADVATVSWTVPAQTLVPGAISLPAGVALSTWTVPGVTVIAGAITVQVDSATSTWVVPSASLVPGGVTVSASSALATWTVPSATVAPGGVTLAASSALASWACPAPQVAYAQVLLAGSSLFTWTVPSATITVSELPVYHLIAVRKVRHYLANAPLVLPTADYDLVKRGYVDAYGGPSLVPIGGSLLADGFHYGVGGAQEGLSVSNLFTAESYTLLLEFALNDITTSATPDAGYQQIIDWHDYNPDSGVPGLYWGQDASQAWPDYPTAFSFPSMTAYVRQDLREPLLTLPIVISALTRIEILVTRTVSGLVSVFTNRVLTYQDQEDSDPTDVALFTRPNHLARFFRAASVNDQGAGIVYRIRVWNGVPLTLEQITHLDDALYASRAVRQLRASDSRMFRRTL